MTQRAHPAAFRTLQRVFLMALVALPFGLSFVIPRSYVMQTKLFMSTEDAYLKLESMVTSPERVSDVVPSDLIEKATTAAAATTTTTKAPSLPATLLERLFSSPPKLEAPLLEKAPTLADYVRDKLENPTISLDEGTISNARENFSLLRANWNDLTAGVGDIREKFTVGGGGAMAVLPDVLDKLNLSEWGAWYVAGAACLVALSQRQAGEAAAREYYQAQLEEAQAKVVEAAESATVAAQGATMAKKMASEADQKSEELLQSKVKAMEEETVMLKKEIEKLTAETAELRAQLKEATEKLTQAVTEPAQEPVVTTAMVESNGVEAKKKAAEKETVPKQEKAKAVKGAKKAAKTVVKVNDAEEQSFGSPAEELSVEMEKTIKESHKAEKSSVKKSSKKAADWSKLSVSTLKRKTVKDLSAYLLDKGVEVKNGEGKPLKKDELVSAVQNL